MHRLAIVSVFLLLAASSPSTAATTLTVTLIVGSDVTDAVGTDPGSLAPLPGHATCDVTVPAGATAEDVLDEAAAEGCIASWACDEFGFDCFVSDVDGLTAQGVTCASWPVACQWWEFFVHDGEQGAITGVRGHHVHDAEVIRFEFHTTCAPTLCL